MPRKTCAEVLSTGRCRKRAIEGSDRCIFHDPEMWKRKPGFIRKKIVEQIKRKDYNFEGYHIPEADFSNLIESRQFKQPANFKNAHFHGKTTFHLFQFESDVSFEGAKFSSFAFFKNAHFSDAANFTATEFAGDADFHNAKFSAAANFVCAKFSATINLGAEFSATADFWGAEFSRFANFIGARFRHVVVFARAKFSTDAYFINTEFSGYANFTDAEFFGRPSFLDAEFSGYANFRNAKFSRSAGFINVTFSGSVSLEGVPLDNVLFDFSSSVFSKELFVDEIQWARKNHRLKIEERDLEYAIRNYHLLKKVFLAMGHYRVAGELFHNEMACRRKLLSLKSIVKGVFRKLHRMDEIDRISKPERNLKKETIDWLWMQIFYFTCGFGERPLRVVGLSFLVICIFTMSYYLILPSVILLERITAALYLSLDCFVALGVFHETILPLQWRWLSYAEAGLGLFMMSLFLVVFSRKMARD